MMVIWKIIDTSKKNMVNNKIYQFPSLLSEQSPHGAGGDITAPTLAFEGRRGVC
jgi:hypothetical protein